MSRSDPLRAHLEDREVQGEAERGEPPAARRIRARQPDPALALAACLLVPLSAQKSTGSDGRIRVALAKQPFSPTGLSQGPTTMAEGGIQRMLTEMGAEIRVQDARLTEDEELEYGGWKRLGYALGYFADLVEQNEREGYLTVGLLATCPSMPGLVAGLQRSGPPNERLRVATIDERRAPAAALFRASRLIRERRTPWSSRR